MSVQSYNPRPTPTAYDKGWLYTEHQSIQRAIQGTSASFVGTGSDDHTAFNTLVNVTIQPQGGNLDIFGNVLIGSNMTVPANVGLSVAYGALLNVADGKTLTINGPLIAGKYRVFNTNTTGIAKFGAGQEVQILWYVQSGKGAALDPFVGWEGAINNADVSCRFIFGGSVASETGVYKSVVALTPKNGTIIQGTGKSYYESPKIVGTHTGVATISYKGVNYCAMRDIVISGDITTHPQVGILMGRNVGGASAGGHLMEHVGVRGYWSKAAVYSIASEDTAWIAPDVQLLGGGGIYSWYTSQDDDLGVGVTGSTNSHITVTDFLIANEVDDAAAATVYVQGGAASINIKFSGGWLGAYRGRYIQVNSGGTTIGNLVGPVEFSMINGESGNGTATAPAIGIELTAGAGQGATDMSNLRIKDVTFEVKAGGNHVLASSGADYIRLLNCDINEIQGQAISLYQAQTCVIRAQGNVTFAGTVYGSEITYPHTGGKTLTFVAASDGNRVYDDVSKGQLTPIKAWFGTATGATASPSAELIIENNVDQFIQLLNLTTKLQGLACGDSRSPLRGLLAYDHSADGWLIQAGGHGIYLYMSAASPLGVISATVGSLCLNVAGGAGTVLYVKETGGSTSAGWVAK